MPRKSAYDTIIKPRFDDIYKWLQNGATEKQIYEALGVGKDAWYKYKGSVQEFADLIKKGRSKLVGELRGALVKKALGFEYTEKKTYTKQDENGNVSRNIEEHTHQALPDVAALNLCLKNYDKDDWANDPQMLELKRQELELKKENAQKDDW